MTRNGQGKMTARETKGPDLQLDIFDQTGIGDVGQRLLRKGRFPDQSRFPLNLPDRSVHARVREDLHGSSRPLIVAGYASLDQIVDLVAAMEPREGTQLRLLLGNEPFETRRRSFVLHGQEFPAEVRDYWLERGISVVHSAKLLTAIERIDTGGLKARCIHDPRRRLHAKIYLGDDAVTLGSSNFTASGQRLQLECNARFCRDPGRSGAGEQARYRETAQIAESYWQAGEDFTDALRDLLQQLLQVVRWQEALARACVELLEGQWAERYLEGRADMRETSLWPSQASGVAQALWVLENTGSVLVADATGSGKTRMGAHLLRALRDRLWSTGRTRSDLSVLICPPAVQATWAREAMAVGLQLSSHSHGRLSRSEGEPRQDAAQALRRAQTLAVDEAHNFLNQSARRTQEVLSSMADHVVLFTATPINRGPADLLRLVDMLGADNMEDETLQVLERLARRKGRAEQTMTRGDEDVLRREIQRFTVRRTKAVLNALVERGPARYADAEGRPCRYPRHESRTYETGESAPDRELARRIREDAQALMGIALLEERLEMPEAHRAEGWGDDRYLQGRLSALKHLALHNIMATLRSSRAALVEHLAGTEQARNRFGLEAGFKRTSSGNMIAKLEARRDAAGRPECRLDCELPAWLTSDERFRAACDEDLERLRRILGWVLRMSPAREDAKARLLADLSRRHGLLLAFDSRLISLEVIRAALARLAPELDVFVATGADAGARRRVRQDFQRSSRARGIALCSDSMAEGINLQGASAIVQLDMPTVVRIAEQRVGRVDRMDSPHEAIEAWWPNDSREFAIRADERFLQRHHAVESLLGGNLELPPTLVSEAARDDRVVTVEEMIRETEEVLDKAPWDGIHDAFGPVHELVQGPRALVSPATYESFRKVEARVLSRISLVSAQTAWAFFAVSGHGHGAPRWILIDGSAFDRPVVGLGAVCEALRKRLSGDVEDHPMDRQAEAWLERFRVALARSERALLPKRKQRALEQMDSVLAHYSRDAGTKGDTRLAGRWEAIRAACGPVQDLGSADLDAVAEHWLAVVRPVWFRRLKESRRRRRPLLLRDISRHLTGSDRLAIDEVEQAFSAIPVAPPLEERIAAAILGIPAA